MNIVEKAFYLAMELHGEQRRKASIVPGAPYMGHLMEVAGMCYWLGCDDEVVAAALLHDAIEDQPGKSPRERILATCGQRVLDLVEEVTEAPKGHWTWEERKHAYLEHLQSLSSDALRIAVADKLQSARELLRDVKRRGNAAFSNFNAGKDRVVWFQQALAETLQARISKEPESAHKDALQALINEFSQVGLALGGRQQ